MKVFMLGCANENGEVVSMKAFLNHDFAQSQMEGEYENEVEYMEDHGSNIDEQECGTDYAAMVVGGNEEFSYHWSIVKKELDASPSDIITALRDSMRDDIERRAEAIVSDYGSARKAVIDLRGEKFEKLSFSNGDTLIRVEAFIGMVGLAVVVKCADGDERNGVVGFDAMDTDELLELHTVITKITHPVRAFNPFWLMDADWHDILINILDKTEEEYQQFISNNPKNKK